MPRRTLPSAPSRRKLPPGAAACDNERRRAGWRDRQRRKRAHDDANEKRYVIFAPEDQLAEALCNSERLTEAEALDHDSVERAIEAVVREWAKRWRGPVTT